MIKSLFKKTGVTILLISLIFIYTTLPEKVHAAAPTLNDYNESNYTDQTILSETTGSITWASGDLIVVTGVTDDNPATLDTPTATGLTFSLVVEYSNTADTHVYVWSATAGSGGSGTVDAGCGTCASAARGISAFVYSGSSGTGATNTIAGVEGDPPTSQISLTRSQDNSAVVIVMGDYNALGDVTVTTTPASGGTQREVSTISTKITSFVLDWTDQGAAGTTSYGVTGYTGGSADMSGIVVEVKGIADTTLVQQTAFRFRNDNGSESAATWLAAENTNITQPTLTNTRLRIQASTTGDIASTQYQLEYKLSTDSWWTKATTTASEYATSTYIGEGTFTSGAGALTVPPPSGVTTGDVMIMCVNTANDNVTTPSGWTEISGSPQGTGVAGAVTSVRLEAFYRIATSSMGNTAIADSGSYQAAQTYAFRGVSTTTPIDTSAGSVETASTTSMSWPSVTTTVPKTFIVQCAGMDDDGADTTNVASAANTNLFELTEIEDTTVTAGNGGGLAVYTGVALLTGAIGNTTATGDLSNRHAYMTIALKPIIQRILIAPSSNITASGEDTTAQLSVPGGKSFTAGRIQDDENPTDAVDIASDRYTEFEWNLIATTTASNGETYDFRVTKNGTVFDTYTVTPQWTIGTPTATPEGFFRVLFKSGFQFILRDNRKLIVK